MRNTLPQLVLVALVAIVSFASCDKGLPLQHAANCVYNTPEELAQSLALCLRDEDFNCAVNYLPGVGNILNLKDDVKSGDTTDFGAKADHLLVVALKKEISNLRAEITAKGGDLSKLKLERTTQTENDAILKMVMYLSAGNLKFTMEPVGLFNSEGSWRILGSRFTTTFE
jgi:hypothetical protein